MRELARRFSRAGAGRGISLLAPGEAVTSWGEPCHQFTTSAVRSTSSDVLRSVSSNEAATQKRSSCLAMHAAVQRGMAQQAHQVQHMYQVNPKTDAMHRSPSPRRNTVNTMQGFLSDCVWPTQRVLEADRLRSKTVSSAIRWNRRNPSAASTTSVFATSSGRGRTHLRSEAPSRTTVQPITDRDWSTARHTTVTAASTATTLQRCSEEDDSSAASVSSSHHLADQSMEGADRSLLSSDTPQNDADSDTTQWDSIRTYLSSSVNHNDQLAEAGRVRASSRGHRPSRSAAQQQTSHAQVATQSVHTESPSSSRTVRSAFVSDAVDPPHLVRRMRRRSSAGSEQCCADIQASASAVAGGEPLAQIHSGGATEEVSTASRGVYRSSASQEAGEPPMDVWQAAAAAPDSIIAGDRLNPEEVKPMHGARACSASSKETPAAATHSSSVEGHTQPHSQINRPAGSAAVADIAASRIQGLEGSVLALRAPPPRMHAAHERVSIQDERLKMREDARRRAAEARTGRFTAPSAHSTQHGLPVSESSLAERSPLFQVAPPLRARRKGRPFEAYIPSVDRNKLQQPGLVCRLLGGSSASDSDASEGDRAESAQWDALRCLSEPCSRTMSQAPEQATAAQYMNVKPVCQHATWNLSASSLLGHLSTERLRPLITSMRKSLGLSSSSTQASATQSSDTRSSTNGSGFTTAAATPGKESPGSQSAKISWTAAARGKNEEAPDVSEDATSISKAPGRMVSAAGAEKWACWKQAVGVAQAMYAKDFIADKGRPPKIVPDMHMMPHGMLQSADQDSGAAEHMLEVYFQSGSWQQAESVAAMHAHNTRLQRSQRASLVHIDALQREQECEHERRQRHQHELDTEEHAVMTDSAFGGSAQSARVHDDGVAGDGDGLEMGLEEGVLGEQDQVHRELAVQDYAIHSPLQHRKSLDLAVLDDLWSQATAGGAAFVGQAQSDGNVAAGTSSQHSDSDRVTLQQAVRRRENTLVASLNNASGDEAGERAELGSFDNWVQPPDWGRLQAPEEHAEMHDLHAFNDQGLNESATSMMHGRATTHSHSQHIDDDEDDEYVDYEHDHLDEDIWPSPYMAGQHDDPLDLERLHGNLPPSLDGLGMAPHDVGIDAFQSPYSPISNAGYGCGDDTRFSGALLGGGFEPPDWDRLGSPRQPFSSLR